MHIAHVLVLNNLRPTAPCCTISEDQNGWKIKLKAENDELLLRHTFFAYRLAFSAITRNIMTLNFIHTKIFTYTVAKTHNFTYVRTYFLLQ